MFYLLFHHNLITFFGFRECILLFISASVIGIIFIRSLILYLHLGTHFADPAHELYQYSLRMAL